MRAATPRTWQQVRIGSDARVQTPDGERCSAGRCRRRRARSAPIGAAAARTSPPTSPNPTGPHAVDGPTPTPRRPTTPPTTTSDRPRHRRHRPPRHRRPRPPRHRPNPDDAAADRRRLHRPRGGRGVRRRRPRTCARRPRRSRTPSSCCVGADARLSMSMGQVRRAEIAALLATHRREAIAPSSRPSERLLVRAKDSIAGVARQTYQDGVIGAFGSVMSADGPADFANRASRPRHDHHDQRPRGRRSSRRCPAGSRRSRSGSRSATAERRTARADAESLSEAHAPLAERISDRRRPDRACCRPRPTTRSRRPARDPRRPGARRPARPGVVPARDGDRRRPEALAAAGDTVDGTGSFVRPATGAVTSPYGWRYHPILHYWKLHTGVDFDGADDVVYAADRGTVIMTVYNAAYGNVTVIDHGMSGGRYLATFYAHQSGFFVEPGDVVDEGPADRCGRQHRHVDRAARALRGAPRRRPGGPRRVPRLLSISQPPVAGGEVHRAPATHGWSRGRACVR